MTRGLQDHIDAMKSWVASTGGQPAQVAAHPIRYGSGDWTRVVGETGDGSRMVTVTRWQDGAITQEYIWM